MIKNKILMLSALFKLKLSKTERIEHELFTFQKWMHIRITPYLYHE